MKLPHDMKIIHVEDYPAYIRLTELLLREAGIDNEIIAITHGNEATRFFAAVRRPGRRPAAPAMLVLLDLDLPGATGQDILRQLRAGDATCDLPVFIVTGNEDPDVHHACLALGADNVLSKPLDVHAFEDAIGHLTFAVGHG